MGVRQHSDNRKVRIAPQLPLTKAEVLNESFHGLTQRVPGASVKTVPSLATISPIMNTSELVAAATKPQARLPLSFHTRAGFEKDSDDDPRQ